MDATKGPKAKATATRRRIAWSTIDYVIGQEFASIDTIAGRLEAYARHFGATFAVLTVWTHDNLFQSLLICLRRTPKGGPYVRDDRAERLLLKLFNVPDRFREFQERLLELMARPGRTLADLVNCLGSPQWIRRFRDVLPLNETVAIHKTDDRLSKTVLGVAIVLVGGRVKGVRALSRELGDDLVLALHAHPAVRVTERRAFRVDVEEKVEEGLRSVVDEVTGGFPERPLHQLIGVLIKKYLQDAIALAGAQGGRWYIAGRDAEYVELLYEWGVASKGRGDRTAVNRRSLVEQVRLDCRPFVANDLSNLRRRYRGLQLDLPVLGDATSPRSILLVPVTFSERHGSPVVSVVQLFGTEPFLLRHLSIVEFLATMYKRSISDLLAGVMSRLFSRGQLTTFPHVIAAVRAAPGALLDASQGNREMDVRFRALPPDPESVGRLPREALSATQMVWWVLNTLVAFTPCFYAAFRCVCRASATLVRHSALLARGVEDTSPAGIALDRPSRTAWVARTGAPLYVSDWSDPECLRDFPGVEKGANRFESKSSLTVPVFAGPRLVGVLHLESMYRNAFADCEVFAQALATALGSELLGSRAQLMRLSTSRLGLRAIGLHKIFSSATRVAGSKELSSTPDESLAQVVNDHLTELRQAEAVIVERSTGPTAAAGGVASAGRTLAAIVDEALLKNKVRYYARWEPGDCGVGTYVGETADALFLIFDELCANVSEAMKSSGRLDISVRRRELGGRQYLSVEMRNPYASLPPDFEAKMFSESFGDESRRGARGGVGAASAASIADGIGGRLYVARVERSTQHVTIAIDVPAPEEE